MKSLTILLMIATAHGLPQYRYELPQQQPKVQYYSSGGSSSNTSPVVQYTPVQNVLGLTSSGGGDFSGASFASGPSSVSEGSYIGSSFSSGSPSAPGINTFQSSSGGSLIDSRFSSGDSGPAVSASGSSQGGLVFNSLGLNSASESDQFEGALIENRGGSKVASGAASFLGLGLVSAGGGGSSSSLASNTKVINIGSAGARPTVEKHVYVHVAPDTQDEFIDIKANPLPPKIHYKIIFIKAPSVKVNAAITRQQQTEEKTIVYVLAKKPEYQVNTKVVQTENPKPEVYFIKYKAKGDNEANNGFDVVEDIRIDGQKASAGQISSSGGFSTSSSGFGGSSTSVGNIGLTSSSGGSSSSLGNSGFVTIPVVAARPSVQTSNVVSNINASGSSGSSSSLGNSAFVNIPVVAARPTVQTSNLGSDFSVSGSGSSTSTAFSEYGPPKSG